MKKPAKPRSGTTTGGRKRHLSADDEELWDHTARTLEPLKRGKARVHTATETFELALKAEVADALRRSSERAGAAPSQGPTFNPPKRKLAASPLVSSKPPPLSDFDKRKARKLGTGQIAIDARIDLHGMRQSEAHTALRRFLFSSFQEGHRWVLVITGKGMRQRAERDDAPWNLAAIEPGVLKRNVPGWLGDPELRAIVISYKSAAARHGGEGALYVHLRNADRASR